jgi:electron-transferring-flavoprotein dehydrogenase
MEFDVLTVRRLPGRPRRSDPAPAAGGAARQRNRCVCVIEEGVEIGAHILSGAVTDPRTLNELG